MYACTNCLTQCFTQKFIITYFHILYITLKTNYELLGYDFKSALKTVHNSTG